MASRAAAAGGVSLVSEGMTYSVGGVPLLQGFTLSAFPHSLSLLLGPQAAGKKTFLALLAERQRAVVTAYRGAPARDAHAQGRDWGVGEVSGGEKGCAVAGEARGRMRGAGGSGCVPQQAAPAGMDSAGRAADEGVLERVPADPGSQPAPQEASGGGYVPPLPSATAVSSFPSNGDGDGDGDGTSGGTDGSASAAPAVAAAIVHADNRMDDRSIARSRGVADERARVAGDVAVGGVRFEIRVPLSATMPSDTSKVTAAYCHPPDIHALYSTVWEIALVQAAIADSGFGTQSARQGIIRDEARRHRVSLALQHCGLWDLRHKVVASPCDGRGLEAGDARRLSIALALLSSPLQPHGGLPKLLVCEEPFSGLSPLQAVEVLLMLRDLATPPSGEVSTSGGVGVGGAGMTVFVSMTAPFDDAFFLADRVGLVTRGSLLYWGPPHGAVDHFTKGPAYPLTFAPPAAMSTSNNDVCAFLLDIAHARCAATYMATSRKCLLQTAHPRKFYPLSGESAQQAQSTVAEGRDSNDVLADPPNPLLSAIPTVGDLRSAFLDSPAGQAVRDDIDALKVNTQLAVDLAESAITPYPPSGTSIAQWLRLLKWETTLHVFGQWGDATAVQERLLSVLAVSVGLGLLFARCGIGVPTHPHVFRQETTSANDDNIDENSVLESNYLTNRAWSTMATIFVFMSLLALWPLWEVRSMFRENGLRVLARDRVRTVRNVQALASMAVFVPRTLALNLLISVLFYYIVGCTPGAKAFFSFYGVTTCVSLISHSLLLVLTNLFDAGGHRHAGIRVFAGIQTFCILLSGFPIRIRQMGSALKVLSATSYLRFAYEAVIREQFGHYRKEVCSIDSSKCKSEYRALLAYMGYNDGRLDLSALQLTCITIGVLAVLFAVLHPAMAATFSNLTLTSTRASAFFTCFFADNSGRTQRQQRMKEQYATSAARAPDDLGRGPSIALSPPSSRSASIAAGGSAGVGSADTDYDPDYIGDGLAEQHGHDDVEEEEDAFNAEHDAFDYEDERRRSMRETTLSFDMAEASARPSVVTVRLKTAGANPSNAAGTGLGMRQASQSFQQDAVLASPSRTTLLRPSHLTTPDRSRRSAAVAGMNTPVEQDRPPAASPITPRREALETAAPPHHSTDPPPADVSRVLETRDDTCGYRVALHISASRRIRARAGSCLSPTHSSTQNALGSYNGRSSTSLLGAPLLEEGPGPSTSRMLPRLTESESTPSSGDAANEHCRHSSEGPLSPAFLPKHAQSSRLQERPPRNQAAIVEERRQRLGQRTASISTDHWPWQRLGIRRKQERIERQRPLLLERKLSANHLAPSQPRELEWFQAQARALPHTVHISGAPADLYFHDLEFIEKVEASLAEQQRTIRAFLFPLLSSPPASGLPPPEVSDEEADMGAAGSIDESHLAAGGANAATEPASTATFSIDDKAKHEDRAVLRRVNGCALPGEVLAIVSPPHGGKTALLEILGGRQVRGRVMRGDVLINSTPIQFTDARRRVSFIHRLESAYSRDNSATMLHYQHPLNTNTAGNSSNPYMGLDFIWGERFTVRDHLTFAILVRLGADLPLEERLRHVDCVARLMAIHDFLDSRIEDILALTGGLTRERGSSLLKRLQIAIELLHFPDVLLAESPVEGMDQAAALMVMRPLHAIATESKRTVVCTLEWAHPAIFSLCHKVLLMSEGRTVFLGTPERALEHFRSTFGVVFGPHVQEHPLEGLVEVAAGTVQVDPRTITDVTRGGIEEQDGEGIEESKHRGEFGMYMCEQPRLLADELAMAFDTTQEYQDWHRGMRNRLARAPPRSRFYRNDYDFTRGPTSDGSGLATPGGVDRLTAGSRNSLRPRSWRGLVHDPDSWTWPRFWSTAWVLIVRGVQIGFRESAVFRAGTGRYMLCALALGAAFWGVGHDNNDSTGNQQELFSVLAFAVFFCVFTQEHVVRAIADHDMRLFVHEMRSGLYSPALAWIVRTAAAAVLLAINCALFITILLPMTSLDAGAHNVSYMFTVLFLTSFTAQNIATACAACARPIAYDEAQRHSTSALERKQTEWTWPAGEAMLSYFFIVFVSSSFAGYFASLRVLPGFYRTFVSKLSFVRWALQGLVRAFMDSGNDDAFRDRLAFDSASGSACLLYLWLFFLASLLVSHASFEYALRA